MDDLLKKIEKMDRYIEDFYKRMKRIVNDCKSELRECSTCELPTLKIDKEFEKFLQQDHVPVKLCKADDEMGEYESDFDDDSESRTGRSENESTDSNDSGDQVGGKIECKRKEMVTINTQSIILSSEEAPDISVRSKNIEGTSIKRKTRRPAQLKHLTKKSEHTMRETQEKILPFSELKNHLLECEPMPSSSSSPTSVLNVPNIHVLDSGDLELPTCADVKLFETYIVTVSGDGITKLDRETKNVLGKLNLKSPGQMCLIGKSGSIGIIQTGSFITIVSTKNDLKVVYKIKTTKPYTNICFVESFTKTSKDLPDPSYNFAAVYTETSSARGKHYTEKVDLVRANATTVSQRVPQYDARVDAFDLTPFDISGISGIGVLWSDGKFNVILGCATTILCVVRSKTKIEKKWEIPIRKAATDVVYVKPKVYVCVQDEGRIMLVDKDGTIENENVLEGILQCRPHKLSVCEDNLLVKSFEETRWRNLVFAKQKTTGV